MKPKPCPFCGCVYDKNPDDCLYAGDHEEGCPCSNTYSGGVVNICVFDDPRSIELWNKRAPAYPGWVSVKDRLPEKYVSVLIAYKDRFGDTSVAGGVVDDQQEWVGIGLSIEPDSVTHWMPLPEAPEK